jgi:hypothetical protein
MLPRTSADVAVACFACVCLRERDPDIAIGGAGAAIHSGVLFARTSAGERSDMTPQEIEIFFPQVMGWIQQTLLAHKNLARSIASKNFKRLPLYFSQAQIEAAKFVIVDRVPVPPLSSIGLTRFKEFERGDYDGITYLDTYFLKKAGADNESLHFHEMIHVVQWRLLGAKGFLAMYANGLEAFGYCNSPLEKMAYDAQEFFARSVQVFDAEKLVAQKLLLIS